jgi:cyanoexosortase B
MQLSKKYPFNLNRQQFNLLIAGLLFVIYAPILWHWVDGWLNKSINIEHEYFSHGLIGIPYAAYVVWKQRSKWYRLEDNSHPLGAILLVLGAIFYITGISTFVNLSLPIILIGICLWLKGIPGLKLEWFPLLLVFLATPNPIPYLMTSYTLPLQKFIAAVAGFMLMQVGFDVTVDQIYLSVDGQPVEVAPYCAGLKMLYTSLYVSLILLHWTGNLKNIKKSLLLLISAGAISVTANIFRNAFLAAFHGMKQPQLFDWLHEGWGGDLYSAAMLGIIVLVLNFMDRFEPETKPETLIEEGRINE